MNLLPDDPGQKVVCGELSKHRSREELRRRTKEPFSNTPSVDAVIRAVRLSTDDRQYKRIRLIMFAPEAGESRLTRPERGKIILLRDQGFHALGLLAWYEKENKVQAVARIFPWLQADPLADEVFGQICDAETARIANLFAQRNLN